LTLIVKIVIQVALNLCQILVSFDKLSDDVVTVKQVVENWVLFNCLHGDAPESIDSLEHCQLLRQSLSNILRSENRLQVHPDTLALLNFID
jgi:hypothetical protein